MTRKDESSEYYIKRLDENRLKDIETLHKAIYGKKPKKNYFLKKYNTTYAGVKYIGYIAYNTKNIPIAFFGVIPCFIQYGNELILCAQAVDAMTLSHFRYKGIFVKLVRATIDLCKSEGICLVFGFPNQNSYHGLVHTLKWSVTERMELFTIPVNAFPLEKLLRDFRWTEWIYKKYAGWILKKYSIAEPGLPSSVIAEGYGGVYRNEEYLKYKSNDKQVIQIGNSKAWIKIRNGLIIGDLSGEAQHFHLLMNTIKKIAKLLGISRIFFHASPGTRLHTLFEKWYKAEASFPVIFLELEASVPLEKIKFTFADIDIF